MNINDLQYLGIKIDITYYFITKKNLLITFIYLFFDFYDNAEREILFLYPVVVSTKYSNISKHI